ncbi:potassium channel family protein [Rhodococcus sp. NPDC003318]|uniref:potassium channel family protein n=1 Tax=Rhodococcus sp. NPDC003318 TaxID=3364503 RepID=UPI0036AD3F40
MSADGDHDRHIADSFASLPKAERRSLIRRAVLRPVISAVLLVVVYFLVPLQDLSSVSAIGGLVISMLVVIAVFVWQIRRIVRARYPGVQSIEALAIMVPTYLLVCAVTYVLLSQGSADSFSEPLSRMDALYFTLVCFSTVGFGDIVPKTEAARAIVSAQIVGNLVLLAAGLRVITAAIRAGRRRRDGAGSE